MFKVNNKDTRTMSLVSCVFILDFEHISHFGVSIVKLKQVNADWVAHTKPCDRFPN